MKNIFSFVFLITLLSSSLGFSAGKIVQGDTYKSLDLSKIWMSYPLTASRALVSSATGTLSASSVTATELGYVSGVTSSIQTQITAKQDAATAVTLTGSQTVTNKTLTAPIVDYITAAQQSTPSSPSAGYNKLYFKSDNFLYGLTSGGAEAAIGTGLINPMTTGGDLIYGGASGTPTRLANGSAGGILRSSGTTLAPTWTTATFPSTTTINQILYSSAANTVTGLATATTGVLATDSSGVPSIVQGTVANRVLRTTGSAISFSTVGLSTDVAGTLPIANGGTNNNSLGVTAGGVTYADGTRLQTTATGTGGQVLTSNGASAPTWSTAASSIKFAPTVVNYLSGSGTYNDNYGFVITSGSATVGATYTHNSVTYTVYATVASSTQIILSGASAPLSSGTLTKASGTGDATLTFSQSVAPLYLVVKMVGGGGGGNGDRNLNAGTAGGVTTFGTSLLTANGGAAGHGAAATSTVNGPAVSIISNPAGTGSYASSAAGTSGGNGAASPFAGAGSGGQSTVAGSAAAVNSGSGGGGGGGTASANSSEGGGAGAYIEAIITNPAASYSYAIGAAGSGGASGTGPAGAAGGSGYISTEEYY